MPIRLITDPALWEAEQKHHKLAQAGQLRETLSENKTGLRVYVSGKALGSALSIWLPPKNPRLIMLMPVCMGTHACLAEGNSNHITINSAALPEYEWSSVTPREADVL